LNTASNTRLRLNYSSWPRPRSHWSASGPRNQHKAFRTKTHQHAQQKFARLATCALHRSDRWPAPVRMVTPVRPVTPIRPVDRAGQAGDYNSHTTNIPGSLSDSSRPWNRNTPKIQPARKKNPTQSLAKQLQNCQELTSINSTQRHTNQAIHLRQILQRGHTDQTGQEHRSHW
jgi:hypothetical protein